MKILIVTELLAPYRVSWFNELGKEAEVTVLYTKDSEESREKNWLSSKPEQCVCKKLNGIHIFQKEICFSLIKELKGDYDIILLDGYGFLTQMLGILYLKLSNREFVMNIDGGLIKENENSIIRGIKKFFIKSPLYYLSSSKTTDKYLEFYGANKENIFHHHFTTLFNEDITKEILSNESKNKIKEDLGIKEKKVIISVGRFIESKGFDILIKSAQYIRNDTGIYIIGGNPTKQYFDIINKYNIENVHFVGFKNKTELKKYYQMADLFALPTRGDVWGLVINEAMACGLPIITTDKCVAGLELVQNFDNGFIVPADDVPELAKKINLILSDNNTCAKMAMRSLEKIKDYTIENMAKKHIEIFYKIINEEKKCCQK